MLSAQRISKQFAGRVLFEDVNFQLTRQERIGLVGPNGAGKTTIFSLILGRELPDEGTIQLEKNCRLGALSQESETDDGESVIDLATAISEEIVRFRTIIRKHETEETTDDPEYHEAVTEFDARGGFTLEPKARRILAGLAFRESDFDRPVSDLSGGWRMRAHLARLLVMEPDLLLLDEPTNHLDLETLGWFQNHLRQYPGAILVISHDRGFLNEIVNRVFEIDYGRLHTYTGNYDAYLIEKKARFEQHKAAYENQQREIARLKRFVDRFRAKASKAAQAQSKLKQLEKIERIKAPVDTSKLRIHFKFPQPGRGGQRTVTLENVDQSYGDLQVYKDLNFSAERGERIVLVGPNGAGKSTLLKILSGEVPVDDGLRGIGHNVTVGYYAQHRADMLSPDDTALQTVMRSPHAPKEETARTLLGCFLFRGDDVFKPVRVLSGGEKSRLALIKTLLNPPNLLLLDEPTTHLDIPSIDALVDAVCQYSGTLVFVSHDVHFIRAVADTVVHIDRGKLTRYAGDYDYYLEKSGAVNARAALTAGQPEAPARKEIGKVGKNASPQRKTKEQKRREAEERQKKARARKELEQRLAKVEALVERSEERQKAITAELEDPETYKRDPNKTLLLNRELVKIGEDLERGNRDWEKLANQLSELTG